MTEKPLLFSGPMVRAILEGRKTMTRRVLKPQPNEEPWWGCRGGRGWGFFAGEAKLKLAYDVGKILWVRENGWERPALSERDMRDGADTWPRYAYDADGDCELEWLKDNGYKRRPSIHMPRWASRITLRVTAVKVERLQDISEEDAKAEGIFYQAPTAEDLEWYNDATEVPANTPPKLPIRRSTQGD